LAFGLDEDMDYPVGCGAVGAEKDGKAVGGRNDSRPPFSPGEPMMNTHRKTLASDCLVLVAVLSCFSGCTSTGRRNLTDSVVVVARPALARQDIRFILELKDTREEVMLVDLGAFLASPAGGHLSRAVKSAIGDKRRKIEQTVGEAAAHPDEVILARPAQQQPYDDDNIVVYLKGRDGYHVYSRLAEINRVFAFKAMASDLKTIRYTHPFFDATVLDQLRAALEEEGIELRNIDLSRAEIEELKTLAAAGILERKLRTLGGDEPVLTGALLKNNRSPKLTRALRDASVFERIISCGDPEVIRALLYLVANEAIELSHP
jgi:hypothetical protein